MYFCNYGLYSAVQLNLFHCVQRPKNRPPETAGAVCGRLTLLVKTTSVKTVNFSKPQPSTRMKKRNAATIETHLSLRSYSSIACNHNFQPVLTNMRTPQKRSPLLAGCSVAYKSLAHNNVKKTSKQ